MTEESTFQEKQQHNPEDSKADAEASDQSIFDSKFAELSNILGEFCEKNNIPHVVLIATDGEQQPLLFSRTDLLGTGSLLASVLREIKRDVNEALNCEPNQSA